ncbi:MAG: chemotaxis protein CheE [Proteobacteria bacterium]|nr:chemotaxis protein CheE [Pseudomonadota bacterium]
MSKARKFRVRSRLSKMINDPHGITVQKALAAANAVLPPIREATLAQTDDVLAEIHRRFGRGAPGRTSENLLDLYKLCLRIIDLAIATPEIGLHEGAHALCDLVDLSLDRGRVDWEAIDVHIEVLRLLRASANQSELQRDLLLMGLKKVAAKRVGT